MTEFNTTLGGPRAEFPSTLGSDLLEVGDAFGLAEADVRPSLEYVRGLLKRRLRRRIREYVSSDDEIEPELRAALQE